MKPGTDSIELGHLIATPSKLQNSIKEELVLRLLQANDGAALLAFEQENRAWFERFIASRGDFFYWTDGIQAHIAQCLAEFAQGHMQPMVLLDAAGKIYGRVNLHAISPQDAKLGYRLAQSVCGQGLAYACAQHLLTDAQQIWQLPQLRAFVAVDNFASKRVLQKLGFIHLGAATKTSQLTRGSVPCDAYLLRL